MYDRKTIIIATLGIICVLLLVTSIWSLNSNTDRDIDGNEAVEEMVIDTPFCHLYYPAMWKGNLRVEQIEGDVYTVKFYAQIEGKEEQHLFDIIFGGEDGYMIGTLNDEGGTSVPVYVVSADFMPDDSWEEEKANTYHAMAEDINYLLDRLNSEASFESTIKYSRVRNDRGLYR